MYILVNISKNVLSFHRKTAKTIVLNQRNSLGWWTASSFWNLLSCRTNRALLLLACIQPPKPRDMHQAVGTARQRPSWSSISLLLSTDKSPSFFPRIIQIIKKQWANKTITKSTSDWYANVVLTYSVFLSKKRSRTKPG